MVTTTIIPITTTTTILLTATTTITTSEQPTWELFSTIIQAQSNIATIGITVIIGLAAIFVGASWLWNFYISRREITNAVNVAREEITNSLEDKFKKLSDEIKNEVLKIETTLNAIINDKMKSFNADQARLFALTAHQLGIWYVEAYWWAEAVLYFSILKYEGLLRISVESLKEALSKCTVFEFDETQTEIIDGCIPYIPDILNQEKKDIKDLWEKLKKKKTGTTES